MMDSAADDLMTASIGRSPRNDPAGGSDPPVLADLSSWENVSKLGRAHDFRLPQWRECMGDYHKNAFKRKCLSNVTWKDGRLACEGRKGTGCRDEGR